MQVKTNEDNLILQCYLTVQFLEALSAENFLGTDLCKKMVANSLLKKEFLEIGIGNQGALLMFLYALLVVPKETTKQEFEAKYSEINKWLKSVATSIETTYKNTNEVRHIRNSVAHAGVKFVPNQYVVFKDSNPRNNNKFELQLPLHCLGDFISKLKEVHVAYVQARG